MTPSRDFMVRQAVLTALHKFYPLTIKHQGVGYVGKRLHRVIEDGFTEGLEFCCAAMSEYRALNAKYGAA